ncbi:flagellar motor protein MotB [Paraburkholderia bonniea]|uniref:flagellar motor protein MotB n=1 Tax=Paraburkholderia bonniea TaxID=2152891 RepID=UPI002573A171|nr:flagellar motor protein MotB [Paraburkholderia bonniea]WJF90784.1 flagellar motor protein MotB [Paraburkholderia bonniea]WJF94098.1 flagellar motor protein MotB [Paraburkholderia bonniea]
MSTARPGAKSKPAHQHETVIKRVSKRHHDDDHGGSWKVAFADFCLALMCLFLLLWVLGARDEETTKRKLDELSSSMVYDGTEGFLDGVSAPLDATVTRETPPDETGKASIDMAARALASNAESSHKNLDGTALSMVKEPLRYESQKELRDLAALLDKIASDADLQNNLRTVVTPYGLRVMLHDTEREGIFERGSTTPSKRFIGLLERMGLLFMEVGNPLLVIGHTDSVQFRSLGGLRLHSNWALSTGRAMVAHETLLRGGMAEKQILQVVGMADRAPLLADTRAAANRRIEFMVLTAARARMLEAMYGAPAAQVQLMSGVSAVVPGSGPAAATAAKSGSSSALADNALSRTLRQAARQAGLGGVPRAREEAADTLHRQDSPAAEVPLATPVPDALPHIAHGAAGAAERHTPHRSPAEEDRLSRTIRETTSNDLTGAPGSPS